MIVRRAARAAGDRGMGNMCMAVPMQVREVRDLQVVCEARGIERRASLLLLPEPVAVGDWVVVHLGHAVAKVSEQEAGRTWALFDDLLAAAAESPLSQIPAWV